MRFLRSLALTVAPLSIVVGGFAAASCIASAPHAIERETDDDAGAGGAGLGIVEAGVPDASFDVAPADPHAVFGTNPSHGPFKGGQRVTISGNGFGSNVRVWFGSTEVDKMTVVPIDPTDVQVNTPAGKAGSVDVTVQNGADTSTKRTLEGGYAYDALYAEPDSGPVSGGTVIEIIGQGTTWGPTTVAKIDQKPCTMLKVDSPTLLACTVPKGSPGSKTVTVTTGSESIDVLDAYTYEDSSNGFKGGLSGAPLAGQLKVLVYDNYTGNAISGAYAIAGSNLASAIVKQTDSTGVAVLVDPSLVASVTVTVAAKCYSPISFVDDPVDTATTYLNPVLDPSCGMGGDPPPVGGKPQDEGLVSGQLVWQGGVEFQKAPWENVPSPIGPNEKATAYVFLAASDPTTPFQVPNPSTAIHPDTMGDIGYAFSTVVPAGNRALYALAGIEDDSTSPAKFTAYVMGLVQGVPVTPNAETANVFLNMTSTLDQALTMNVAAPITGPKGPDRLVATVAVMLGNDGFAILPIGRKTPLLPVQGSLSFVGVPFLGGALFGSDYYSTAHAVTGPGGTAPMSVVSNLLSTNTAQPVNVNGFIAIPTLVTPAFNGAWDGRHLATNFAAQGGPIDFTEYAIESGNGLVTWTVVVPKATNAVELPDLSGFPQAGVPPGPLTIGVFGAHVEGFDYTKLLYRNLVPSNMTAYSLDYFNAHL